VHVSMSTIGVATAGELAERHGGRCSRRWARRCASSAPSRRTPTS
jgi:hypothetical protein